MKELYLISIPGAPIVKKNNQKVSCRANRPTKYNTKAYELWRNVATITIIGHQRPPEPINQPVILQCTFFMPTRRRVDLSALYEGIQDELVKTGVLADDNCSIVVGHDGSRVLYDKENPRTEVKILALEQTGVI